MLGPIPLNSRGGGAPLGLCALVPIAMPVPAELIVL